MAETLDSALAQTHRPLEVVVVDDGSTDGTLALARRYEAAHADLVRVIAQENQGACAARNRALAEARGDFIQYLDADDVLHPEKIERQLRRLVQEQEGTIATGPWVRFAGKVAAANHDKSAPDWQDYEPATDWLIQALGGRGTMPTVVWLVPRALSEIAGPWNEKLLRNQDGEYFARIAVRARKIAFCEGAWGYYRASGPQSVSARRSEAALRSLFEASSLCEQTLLNYCDTQEARRACAGLWQQFLFTAYPLVPDLIQEAEQRVALYGGMYRKPNVSRPLALVRDLIGWKPALRLQHLYRRSGLEDLIQRFKS